jgi:hypothetical protein
LRGNFYAAESAHRLGKRSEFLHKIGSKALKTNSHVDLNFSRLAVAFLTAFAVASCAIYSRVSEKRPRLILSVRPVGVLANAGAEIARGMGVDRREPLAAFAEYISAAETALRQLKRSPQDETARQTYNFAVGRIITTVRDAKLDPWTEPLRQGARGPKSQRQKVRTT